MTSIFDSITVPSASQLSLEAVGTAASPSSPSLREVVGSTGLVAVVGAEELLRLVRESVNTLVLTTQVRVAASADKKRAAGVGYRYVFPCAGIVFVTTSAVRLSFDPGVREVNCLGVLHEGKPLGRDETQVQ